MPGPFMWYCKAEGRKAHEFDSTDPRIPMRARCGYKAWPQELHLAGNIGMNQLRPYHLDDPEYCPKCMKLGGVE